MEKIYMDMPQLIKLIRMQYVFHLLEQIPVPFFFTRHILLLLSD